MPLPQKAINSIQRWGEMADSFMETFQNKGALCPVSQQVQVICFT
jgi:hypothetical protein